LSLVTTEPRLTELVARLQELKHELLQDATSVHELVFLRAYIEEIRQAFARMILHGEESLHRLAQLIGDSYLNNYQIQSVVIGEVESTKERFTIIQSISAENLYSTTDIDLGNRQLHKLRFDDGNGWSRANLVANMVEYQPTQPNPYEIHKIISRIKAEEEIWNKVVDEIFDLDSIVVKDKQLQQYSYYVKDIFGLKIVVGEVADIYAMQENLQHLTWPDELLFKYQLEPTAETRRLEVVEVKDYLADYQKQTGWEAVKLVVRWSGKTFEIQIQSLRNFLHEREVLTRESHTSFKANRERVRQQVAARIPLFGFYQNLLRWLFVQPDEPPPAHPRVKISLFK